jgi:hypothetical protein
MNTPGSPATRSPLLRRTLGAIACALTLPPCTFALFWPHIFIPAALHSRYWEPWAIVGCLAGLTGAVALSLTGSRRWALLAIPAIADGWVAVELAIYFIADTH